MKQLVFLVVFLMMVATLQPVESKAEPPLRPERTISTESIPNATILENGSTEKACVTMSITCGSMVESELTPDDCEITDGARVDFWEFPGALGSTVTIDMESDEFDTFLFLFDPGTTLRAQDDDNGSGTNSQIVFLLDTDGLWTIGASGFGPRDLGNYSLRLECEGGNHESIFADGFETGTVENWSSSLP